MYAVFHRNFMIGRLFSASIAMQGCKPLSAGSNVLHIEHGPVYSEGFALYITLEGR
jgi:hypothetical protein